jgi:hypothetical protein
MRFFLVGVLTTGLLLMGLSTYERQAASAQGEIIEPFIPNEDGTGFPYPHPTPTPRPVTK